MSGNIKDMNDSRTDALQALLNSMSPKGSEANSSSNLSSSQLKHLTDKINNILGGAGENESSQQTQLVDDEGLPIIDIIEPAEDTTDVHPPVASFHEPDLLPISSLSVMEREERRRKRDHILDMIEEEERTQLEKYEEEESGNWRDNVFKRNEAAKAELERLRAAKDVQKKMGKALLKNLAEAREKEELGRKDLAEKESSKSDSSKPKKTVTFADPSLPDEFSASEETQTAASSSIEWGDISPARLRSINRVPLPIRLHVVERHPASSSKPPAEGDSDDEPLSPTSLAPNEDDDMVCASCTSSSDDDDDASDEGVLEEEFDWDSAQHHREVVLDYYKKRHAIGAEAARAMTSHAHDDEDWSQANIPPDERPKPSMSRYRADRMVAAYDRSTSTSLGPVVIPASRQKSMQEAVRIGKLDNNQLVGGDEGESGSEDEAVREVLELLKNGRIQNAGPDFVVQSAQISEGSEISTSTPLKEPGAMPSVPATLRPSRFKMARSALASGYPSPSPVSEVVERRQFKHNPPHQRIVEPPSSAVTRETPSFPCMIMDSHSLPRRKPLSDAGTSRPQRPPVVMQSTVKESSGLRGINI